MRVLVVHRGFCIDDDKGLGETRQDRRGITGRRYREITQGGRVRQRAKSIEQGAYDFTDQNKLLTRCGAQPHALIYEASNSFTFAFNKIALLIRKGKKNEGQPWILKGLTS